MGLKAMIVMFVLFAFSLIVLNPSIRVLPSWLYADTQLYNLTLIIWLLSFSLLFIKFGLDK